MSSRGRAAMTITTAALVAVSMTGAAGGSAAARKPSPKAPPRPAPKVAYLTFDDGPTSTYTPQVLKILGRYRAKATFFMIGRQAEWHPELVAAVRSQGHAIGNHTWDHPNLVRTPAAEVLSQLQSTSDAIGGRVRCMRPPGGAADARVKKLVQRTGMTLTLWNVDTRDWSRPGVPAITTAALGKPAGGGSPVILMHDGGGDRTQTISALPGVLDALKRKGYRFESLPTCR